MYKRKLLTFLIVLGTLSLYSTLLANLLDSDWIEVHINGCELEAFKQQLLKRS